VPYTAHLWHAEPLPQAPALRFNGAAWPHEHELGAARERPPIGRAGDVCGDVQVIEAETR